VSREAEYLNRRLLRARDALKARGVTDNSIRILQQGEVAEKATA
jgi:hypothetical protein